MGDRIYPRNIIRGTANSIQFKFHGACNGNGIPSSVSRRFESHDDSIAMVLLLAIKEQYYVLERINSLVIQ